jgi:hypothetical protein
MSLPKMSWQASGLTDTPLIEKNFAMSLSDPKFAVITQFILAGVIILIMF